MDDQNEKSPNTISFPESFYSGRNCSLCQSEMHCYLTDFLSATFEFLSFNGSHSKIAKRTKSQGSSFLYLKNKNRSLCGVNLMNVEVISQ